jgi:enoyl-CoA hydratase
MSEAVTPVTTLADMSDLVGYELDNGIATVTLNNGKVNAISPDVIAELNACLDRSETDEAIMILTGRPGILSGGYDLKVMTSGPGECHRAGGSGFHAGTTDARSPVPDHRRVPGACRREGCVHPSVR